MKNLEDLMVAQYENVESISNDDIFEDFYDYMKNNIKYDMDKQELIDFVSQYILLEPVFNMLFVSVNEITVRLKNVISYIKENCLLINNKELENIYDDINKKVCNIKTQEDKQNIIIEAYNTFFKNACKDKCELHGIVFTPIEVVDFIIYSVESVLQKHFGKSISDDGVHVLDPFTGTGTFIVRLLQSGLISKEDLLRKYTQELQANEIILLSYYIAAINIEETFHSIMGEEYTAFEGIVLTDTFESTEKEDSFMDELFGENNERLEKQLKEPIFAIIGNPPYSVGAKNENESSKNKSYPKLDSSIANTYAKFSNSKSIRGIYDTYVKAFRWATNRIGNRGVIGFVTNGQFIDSKSADGLRKCWFEEFNYVYVFNLRGDARTSGEQRRKEAGNIFKEGSRTPIAITVLVKDESERHEIYYHDIGDYLSREEKLSILERSKSIEGIPWKNVIPDKNNDWINIRDENYENYLGILGDIFYGKQDGIQSNRDSWVYNFSSSLVLDNAERMIDNYNTEVERLSSKVDEEKMALLNTDEMYVSWSRSLKNKLKSNRIIEKKGEEAVISSMYYPFVKKYLYYNRDILEYPRKFDESLSSENIMISVSGAGTKKGFSAFVTNTPPNYNMLDKGRHFELYRFNDKGLLFDDKSNLNENFETALGLKGFDAFAYVYAILHSNEYREKYQNNLIKDLPRIPIVKQAKEFSEIGKKLIELHLNYEKVDQYSNVVIESKSNPSYKVQKMKHPKKGVLDQIVFNNDITISNIPAKAYEYVVNGRPAIEWIIDQYQVKMDKKSGIVDDPNLYSEDEHYIFDLLLRIINVSVQTVDLVNSLPPLEIEE